MTEVMSRLAEVERDVQGLVEALPDVRFLASEYSTGPAHGRAEATGEVHPSPRPAHAIASAWLTSGFSDPSTAPQLPEQWNPAPSRGGTPVFGLHSLSPRRESGPLTPSADRREHQVRVVAEGRALEVPGGVVEHVAVAQHSGQLRGHTDYGIVPRFRGPGRGCRGR